MVTAGVVEVDPATRTSSLPAEHAAFLTRAAAADNIAVFAQYIAVLGGVEDDIVECFKQGGGVPYAQVSALPRGDGRGQRPVGAVVARVAHPAAGAGLAERLDAGIRVLDVGCGRGRIAARGSRSSIRTADSSGMDLSAEAIALRASRRRREGPAQRRVRRRRSERLRRDGRAEALRLRHDLRRRARSGAAAQRAARASIATLKPDGVYLMQDIKGSSHVHKNIEHPIGTFLYTVSCMHCMTVSLAQGGEGLGAMWGEEKTREYLRARRLPLGRDAPARARHPEQLVRRQEVSRRRRPSAAARPAHGLQSRCAHHGLPGGDPGDWYSQKFRAARHTPP